MNEITSIVVGEKTIPVTDLSKEAQQIVALFNKALQQEVTLQDNLTLVRLSKEQLQTLLVKQLNADAAEAEQQNESKDTEQDQAGDGTQQNNTPG